MAALCSLFAVLLLSFLPTFSAKSLWSTVSATNYSALLQHAYPMGNGRLAALSYYGLPRYEKLSLNRDNLWSGNPFANSSCNGEIPTQDVSHSLPGIRDWTWRNGTGNVTKLMGNTSDYGSCQVLGNLSVKIYGLGGMNGFKRSLNLETDAHTTTFDLNSTRFTSMTYCSYPDDVCVYDLESTATLPSISIAMEQLQRNASIISTSCSDRQVRLTGTTQVDPGSNPEIGMKFDGIAKVDVGSYYNANKLIVPASGRKRLTVVLVAGTNYDEMHGSAEFNYSFHGTDQ